MTPLAQLDLTGLHVLDGAMATELEQKGFDLSGPLWSAHVLEDAPWAIREVHSAYLEAGADCLLTASYQVSTEGFQKLGFARPQAEQAAERALRRSVALAIEARDAYPGSAHRPIWIGASLGPYGAMLHNGAEYHGNYECTFKELVEFHSRRIAVLVTTAADFLAFESIPSIEEAQAILVALRPFPEAGAYLSFTCRDGVHVSHGELIRKCAALLDQEAQVIGIGVNCTAPALINSLIGEAAQATRKPILVYPNSGEGWDAARHCWQGDGQTEEFGEQARSWQAAGARWIGGCCRTGPDHVRAVAGLWR